MKVITFFLPFIQRCHSAFMELNVLATKYSFEINKCSLGVIVFASYCVTFLKY